MNFTLNLNTKKLEAMTNALKVIGDNINVERHNQQQKLETLRKLNLSADGGENGIMDLQIEQNKSMLKFLATQEELLLEIIQMGS